MSTKKKNVALIAAAFTVCLFSTITLAVEQSNQGNAVGLQVQNFTDRMIVKYKDSSPMRLSGLSKRSVDSLSVDLAANLLPGYDMISDSFVGNDGDGRDSDANDPGDWVDAGQCGGGKPTQDLTSSWHGTHVSGTIAALTDASLVWPMGQRLFQCAY